jgi:hypothetical protein
LAMPGWLCGPVLDFQTTDAAEFFFVIGGES